MATKNRATTDPVKKVKTIKKPKSNVSEGVNPHTGKEFLLLTVKGGKVGIRASYQTRYGAAQNKKSGELIILRSKLPGMAAKYRKEEVTLHLRRSKAQEALVDAKLKLTELQDEQVSLLERAGHEVRITQLRNKVKSLQGNVDSFTNVQFWDFDSVVPRTTQNS